MLTARLCVAVMHCTHVLCECARTQAFEQVSNQPEECDVVCANGQWLRVCIKQSRRVSAHAIRLLTEP